MISFFGKNKTLKFKTNILSELEWLCSNPPASKEDAHSWFVRFQVVSEELSETQMQNELNFQCQLNSEEFKKQFAEFERDTLIPSMQLRSKLMEVFLQCPWGSSFFESFAEDAKTISPEEAWDKISQEIQLKKKISSSQIVKLQHEEAELTRSYKSFFNSLKTVFSGKEMSLPVLLGKLNDSNTYMRKEAFKTYWQFIENNKADFEKHFQKLLENRIQQSEINNLSSYAEFAHTDLGRTQYSLLDSKQFCESIEIAIVPLLNHFFRTDAKEYFEHDYSLPWNFSVPENISFSSGLILDDQKDIQANLELCTSVFGNEVTLAVKETFLSENCDLYPRKNKAGGAFCMHFQKSKRSFVFANFGGNYKDFTILLHEFGHAIHGNYSSYVENHMLRTAPIEFSEFSALAFETIGGAEISKTAKRFQAAQVLFFLPTMAKVYLWQVAVYERKILCAAKREELWLELGKRFTPYLDWSNCPSWEKLGWMNRPHAFSHPLYFVEYGIAYIGVSQLWQALLQDKHKAQNAFLSSLKLGGTKSLPALFEAAGLNWDLSPSSLAKNAQFLFHILRTTKQ